MGPFSRTRKPAGWRLWILLMAWVCANSPQPVAYRLVAWCAHARHFSHQDRLRADVALLLHGEKRAVAVQRSPAGPALPIAPPIPDEALLKRIDLSAEMVAEWVAPALGPRTFCRGQCGAALRDAAAPPLPPPRVLVNA
jgi:hypothetical protein